MKRGALFLLAITMIFACTAPAKIIRETSSPAKPEWINQPPHGNETLYFVGISSGTETLEEGREAAIKDAIAKISGFIGTKIKSEFEERSTEITQRLKSQIKAETAARVSGAKVVDAYHEKAARIDKNFRMEKYDVYVLVSFLEAEAEKELKRRKIENEEKAKTAYRLYLKGKKKEDTKAYSDARSFYARALSVVSDTDDVATLNEGEVRNSGELVSLLDTRLLHVTGRMRRVSLSVKTNMYGQASDIFKSNIGGALGKHGFTITSEEPAIEINGKAYVSKSGFVLNSFAYYAEGNLTAIRKSDNQVIATVPFKIKGFHRTRRQAALNALAEAGNVAGKELAKILLAQLEI